MNKLFFTSDTHFGHTNILKYSKRPFKTIEEMNEHIITEWNKKVGPTDIVYHLGDFAFCSEAEAEAILKRLNGQKHFVSGNHDKLIHRSKKLQSFFVKMHDYLELKVNDETPTSFQGQQMIVLFHFPIMSWNKMHRGAWHLHGHCHHNLQYPFKGRIIDVGVDGDGYNYAPISYEEVKVRMAPITRFESLDHHNESRM